MSSNRAHLGKLLRISSADRVPGQLNSNFSLSLNNASFVQKVKACVLKSVSFKHVFPNIFQGNNVWRYEYLGTPYEITIPVGWWNATTFASKATELFNANGTPISVTVETIPAGSSPAQNGRFVIDSTPNAFTLFGKNASTPNPIGDVLGLPPFYEEISNTTSIPPYSPDLGGLTSVYLCSSAVASYNAAGSFDNGENLSLITEIPIDGPYGSQINYRANDSALELISYQNARQLTSADFQLCTRDGTVLDTQQHAVTILLRLVPMGSYGTA